MEPAKERIKHPSKLWELRLLEEHLGKVLTFPYLETKAMTRRSARSGLRKDERLSSYSFARPNTTMAPPTAKKKKKELGPRTLQLQALPFPGGPNRRRILEVPRKRRPQARRGVVRGHDPNRFIVYPAADNRRGQSPPPSADHRCTPEASSTSGKTSDLRYRHDGHQSGDLTRRRTLPT